ncbi:MAG: hypothetical protein NXI32_03660 [bacterium]|nr:hypothetical protein [bacterium]
MGSQVTIRAKGSNLAELDQMVVTPAGCETQQHAASNSDDPSLILSRPPVFDLHIPTDQPPGLYEAWVHGRHGISNPRAFLVTQHPVRSLSASDGSDAALPIMLEAETIYLLDLQPARKTYLAVRLEQGQFFRCAAYAHQLDSQAIPALTLQHPDGSELGQGRAIQNWPAEIEFRAEQTGDYLLIVHDFLYRGGQGFQSALECSIDLQPSSQAEQIPKLELELDQLLRPKLDVEAALDASARFAFADPTAIRRLPSWEQVLHHGSSDTQAPFVFAGDFRSSPSASVNFRAKGGQQHWIQVYSASAGQLTDPRMLVFEVPEQQPAPASSSSDEGNQPVIGNQLLENDEPPAMGGPDMRLRFRDPVANWTPAKDGMYRIVVVDQQSGQRPFDSRGFLLGVRPARPRFSLLAFHDVANSNRQLARPAGSALMGNGTAAIRVQAIREDGFDQAIEVRVSGLPEFLSCRPSIIPPSATETSLIIEARQQVDEWFAAVTVTGRSMTSESNTNEQTAFTAAVIHAANPVRNAVQNRFTQQLWVSTTSLDVCPLRVELGQEQVYEAAQGSKLSIPVRIFREDSGKVACVLRAQDLPPNCKLPEVSVAADKNEAVAELQVADNTPPGDYTFWMQNEVRLSWRKNPQSLERAEKHLMELRQQLESSSEDQRSSLTERIQAAEALLETLKQGTAPQNLIVWLPTNSLRVRVLAK